MISVGICRACSHGGTVYDGLCDRCRPRPTRPAPLTVAEACATLADELREGGIALPTGQRATVAATLACLCHIAGAEVPAAVLAALDGPEHTPTPTAIPSRRGYRGRATA